MRYNKAKIYVIYLPEKQEYLNMYNLETRSVRYTPMMSYALHFAGKLAADICAQKLQNIRLIGQYELFDVGE